MSWESVFFLRDFWKKTFKTVWLKQPFTSFVKLVRKFCCCWHSCCLLMGFLCVFSARGQNHGSQRAQNSSHGSPHSPAASRTTPLLTDASLLYGQGAWRARPAQLGYFNRVKPSICVLNKWPYSFNLCVLTLTCSVRTGCWKCPCREASFRTQ